PGSDDGTWIERARRDEAVDGRAQDRVRELGLNVSKLGFRGVKRAELHLHLGPGIVHILGGDKALFVERVYPPVTDLRIGVIGLRSRDGRFLLVNGCLNFRRIYSRGYLPAVDS